jgi:hypothetical protein
VTTLTLEDPPVDRADAGQRLRRTAAAVRVSFTWWGITKALTSEQKEEVGEAYGADASFLTAAKKLIDRKHPAYKTLTSLRSQIKSYWRGITLPYVEPRVRLIRQSDIEGFVTAMEERHSELKQAEMDLEAVYDEIRSQARQRLRKLYDAGDYPSEIKGLFDVAWDFPSIEPPNYLMRLNPELYAQEQERITRRFEEAVHLAEQAFVAEFARLISHLTERLTNDATGERRIFRDSAISNLTEFFEKFRHLNVNSNAELDQLVGRAQDLVKGVQPQELRIDDSLRQHIAREMVQVGSQLEALIVDQPRRQIIRRAASPNGGADANGHR